MLSNFARDTYIAPEVSEFVAAEIPDMLNYDKNSTFWVRHFFLNSMLRAKVKPVVRAYLYNFFRRCEAAFREHGHARDATLAFLASGRESLPKYTLALFHWEAFLGQSWHAMKILQSAFGFILFEPGDNSVEMRLNALYNQMKHVESRIANGQILENATVPVWLTNHGLRSTDAELTWAETGEVLKDLAKWANVFVDPLTVPEKLDTLGIK